MVGVAGVSVAVEVSVDRGSRYAEQVGDLLHRLLAGVVQLLGERGLIGGKPWFPAADPSTGPGGGEAALVLATMSSR